MSEIAGSDPLASLARLRRDKELLDEQMLVYVRQARLRRHSWRAIAGAVGVSRQAAWERFHSQTPNRAEVIAEALGSLAGPGPSSEQIRAAERETGDEAEARRKL